MEFNLPKRLVKDITVFALAHGIEKVVLFGSSPRRTNRERSDVELGEAEVEWV